MEEDSIRLECVCGTAFHTMKFEIYEDDFESGVSISFHLNQNTSFWDRLRYVFGLDVVFGAYDNIMTNITELEYVIEQLKNQLKRKSIKEINLELSKYDP